MMKLLICGKGGCGKSTVAALIAAVMSRQGRNVFLVDADESNIGLYKMLGLELPIPLMDNLGGKKGFREKVNASGLTLDGTSGLFPKKMKIDELPDECVARSDNIRVMSVGKIHHFGEGCACPMGNLFRMLFSSLVFDENDLVIVDTAAGVEHFGRSLDRVCDKVLCVADPSYESIRMAKKVGSFASEAGLEVRVILNRLALGVEQELNTALEDVNVIGQLPENRSIFINNLKGRPLDMEIPEMVSICESLEI